MKPLFSLFLVAWLLSACRSALPSTATPVMTVPALSPRAPVSSTSTITLIPTPTPLPPASTFTPTATENPPSATPPPVCVTLIYEDYAQFEIIAPDGFRVMVDVTDPARLSAPAAGEDVLLTTHTHWDHVNADFQSAFPGQQLMTREGTLTLAGVNIRGIASAHNAGDTLKPEGGTNYIYLIEMAGLRIAHFGDIGQNSLTDAQLEALGQLDVAIIQLANPYSEMDAENQKGLKLIEQIVPRLVIPTHVDLDTATLAAARWPGLYTEQASISLCLSDLPEQTQILFMGQPAITFLKYLKLSPVDW